ncbi:MAG: ATP-binding protein [Bacilli bacterium]|jgi:predicted AAA+ superfamily ATPase|nr:ATP-binding protein [Bacilli bacterium]
MELKRKINESLLKWKNRPNHKPLIIEGLRQVGKSYSALKFAKENYENWVLFDFRHDRSLQKIFENNGDDGRVTLESIIAGSKIRFPDKSFEKGKTCLVFDEVGDCPLVRESFKIFGVDSGYDIIATGSLLGVAGVNEKAKKNTPVGYEEYVDMTALDFEEFLWANKVSDEAIREIKNSVVSFSEVSPTIHSVLSSRLLRYVVVGGMPEAVVAFLNSKDLLEARNVQIRLLKDYEDDFGKKTDRNGVTIIDPTLLIRTQRAYRSISDQLAKENKKFKYSCVQGGGRSSEFSDALAWMEKTGLIVMAHNLRAIESPLSGNSISEEFKVYPTDIGLLTASYPLTLTQGILNGDLGAYKGAVYEALAADMQYKAGLSLYYYSDTKRHQENDFLIEEKDGISVVESKAKNGKMASAKALAEGKTPYKILRVYKLISGNFGKGSFYFSLPQYAFPFLLETISGRLRKGLVLPPLPKI